MQKGKKREAFVIKSPVFVLFLRLITSQIFLKWFLFNITFLRIICYYYYRYYLNLFKFMSFTFHILFSFIFTIEYF